MKTMRVNKREKAEAERACACCGRTITNLNVLETSEVVGDECAGLIEFASYRFGRKLTKRQAAFFAGHGLEMPAATKAVGA